MNNKNDTRIYSDDPLDIYAAQQRPTSSSKRLDQLPRVKEELFQM